MTSSYGMLGRRRYGRFGMVGLPFQFLFEWVAVPIEMLGWIVLVALAATGNLNVGTTVALFGGVPGHQLLPERARSGPRRRVLAVLSLPGGRRPPAALVAHVAVRVPATHALVAHPILVSRRDRLGCHATRRLHHAFVTEALG